MRWTLPLIVMLGSLLAVSDACAATVTPVAEPQAAPPPRVPQRTEIVAEVEAEVRLDPAQDTGAWGSGLRHLGHQPIVRRCDGADGEASRLPAVTSIPRRSWRSPP